MRQVSEDGATSVTFNADDQKARFTFMLDGRERELIPPTARVGRALIDELTTAAGVTEANPTGTLTIDLPGGQRTLRIESETGDGDEHAVRACWGESG